MIFWHGMDDNIYTFQTIEHLHNDITTFYIFFIKDIVKINHNKSISSIYLDFDIPGAPTIIEVDIMVRSMGPISEGSVI